ncbi:MAG: RNA polymerase sigma factor [Myxococcales bacterium]|nr:RNA polymerase sigma factor [Myxococcales bacterium]
MVRDAVPSESLEAHPDALLIARLTAGHAAAYRELFRQHSDEVYRLARRFVTSDTDAEEVTQEVFIAAHQSIGRFRGHSRLRTWLFRITVNRALKHRRWWLRRRESGAESLTTAVDAGVSPEQLAHDREQLARLRVCIAQLEVRKRTVLVLHELEGLDTATIAEVLECPRSTVLTRLARARADLVRLAEQQGIEIPSSKEESP